MWTADLVAKGNGIDSLSTVTDQFDVNASCEKIKLIWQEKEANQFGMKKIRSSSKVRLHERISTKLNKSDEHERPLKKPFRRRDDVRLKVTVSCSIDL
jgi:hypothetical protein